MANDTTRATDGLSALIAEIEAEAYARGKADAGKELLDMLRAGGAPAAPVRARRGSGRSASSRAGRPPPSFNDRVCRRAQIVGQWALA